MKILCLCLAAFTTAVASAETDAEGWSGELSWTLYSAGGQCDDGDPANVAATGSTTSVTNVGGAKAGLCETDVLNLPDGGTMAIYTKFQFEGSVCVSDGSAELVLYDCTDDTCGNCAETPETDGVVPSFVLQEVWTNPQGCLAFFPKGNATWGGITWEDAGVEPASAQSFDDSASLVETQAYWEYLFGSICGEDWFTNIVTTGNADNADAPAEEDWTGELPFTLYKDKECSEDESNVVATGKLISVETISPQVLCETSSMLMPGDTETTTVYTKVTKPVTDCGDRAEFVLYNCIDAKCSDCEEDPEGDLFVESPVIKDAYNDPAACYSYATEYANVSMGDYTGPIHAQAFDSTVELSDSQAYWSFLFGETCGEAWFAEYIVSDDDGPSSTASPTKAPTSGSVVSFGAVWATLVWIGSVVIVLVA